MLAKVHSGAVYGIDAYPVEIEAYPTKLQRSCVNERRGDPQTIIVGLPDAAVQDRNRPKERLKLPLPEDTTD